MAANRTFVKSKGSRGTNNSRGILFSQEALSLGAGAFLLGALLVGCAYNGSAGSFPGDYAQRNALPSSVGAFCDQSPYAEGCPAVNSLDGPK